MKILVTGASGNVGGYVIKALLKMGETVVAAGTDSLKLRGLFDSAVEVVAFDFTDPTTYDAALSQVDRIFLMRPPHLGKPEDLYPFLEKVKEYPIQLLSFLSLMGIENNKIPPHYKIEKYIERLEIPFSHIRPGFFMQNISGVHAEEIRERDMVFVPAGKSKTSFIDATDIGLAIATVLHTPQKHQNTAYTITGPEALDYYAVADILSATTGRKIQYANPGFLEYRRDYILRRGLDPGYVNVTVALYFMTRMGTAKAVTDAFYKLTGHKPRTFSEFARDNVQAFDRKR
jgi:uncharacterized protein YbjT (DUF2867 family)